MGMCPRYTVPSMSRTTQRFCDQSIRFLFSNQIAAFARLGKNGGSVPAGGNADGKRLADGQLPLDEQRQKNENFYFDLCIPQ